jgi:hypothetical protein
MASGSGYAAAVELTLFGALKHTTKRIRKIP